MKSNIPPKVAETLKEIGMTSSQAGWDCHGTYVLLHKALEKVSVKFNIKFDKPVVFSLWDTWETSQNGLLEKHPHQTIRIVTRMLWQRKEPKIV
jgi:hypothetical protein